ncbi:hypothetical protein Btru_067239 [Bulinus truncatus]|nr:hypothetical protein Btru_067239 [Bulinus truncatus]
MVKKTRIYAGYKQFPEFQLAMQGDPQLTSMIFSFKPTDDFEPVLPDTLTTGINVPERTANGTVLLNFHNASLRGH